ncbi:UNVERIFIED_CONTAM: phage major capsid protein, partial [Pseudomonas aeruginosa]
AKALQIGVDADGGYAVPEELDRNIIELLRDESPMRQVCNQIFVGTPDYKRLANLGGAGSGWVGETAPRPETSTPTLAQISAVMGELYANPQATQTSLDDMFFDVEGWLNSEVGREFSEKEGAAFLLGDGVNKPKGLLAYPFAVAG